MTLVSVLGYAKSGKTTFVETMVRALADRGEHITVVKTGGSGHRSDHRGGVSPTPYSEFPDSRRCAAAGAQLSLFWSPQGLVEDCASGPRIVYPQALPERGDFFDGWLTLLPPDLRARIDCSSWVIIEGRPVMGAWVVQLGTDGELKYPRLHTHYRISRHEDIPSTVRSLIDHGLEALPAQGGTHAGKE